MVHLAFALLSAATLADVSFLAGAWQGEISGALIEEHWMEPRAGAAFGMYRIVKDGKTLMSEMCAVEQRPEGLVLLLRHFNPGLVAREDKESPATFPLESHGPNRAVFYSPATTTRISYELTAPDELRVTLEKEKDGQSRKSVFSYRRMRR